MAFTKSQTQKLAQYMAQVETLAEQAAEIKAQITEALQGASLAAEVQALTAKLTQLQKDYSRLGIEKDQLLETFDRERRDIGEKAARAQREIEHMVGLERTRSEAEADLAKREAKAEVREENLAAQRKQFDDHVKFITEANEKHMKDMKSLLEQVLTRLPTVTAHVGDPVRAPRQTR